MEIERYHLTIEPVDGPILYHESFDGPFMVPRIGEDIFLSGEAAGSWTVVNVFWILPNVGAMVKAFWPTIEVRWADRNTKLAPTYDEDKGWIRGES